MNTRKGLKMKKITLLPLLSAVIVTACSTQPTTSAVLSSVTGKYTANTRPYKGSEVEARTVATNDAQSYCNSLNGKLHVDSGQADEYLDYYRVSFRCLRDDAPELSTPTLAKAPETKTPDTVAPQEVPGPLARAISH